MYFRFCLKAQTFLQWNRFSGMFALLWRWIQSRVKVVAILCFWVHTIGRSFSGGRSDCGCAYEICSDLLNRFRGFCGSNPCISVGFLDDHTSARFKSYQFLKVVSGGRAPGKSSSFASSQLLVIERFHCFRAVRLEKVQFLVSRWFLKLIFVHSFKGVNAGCCLLACFLPAACCCLLLLLACLGGWDNKLSAQC